MDSRRSRPSPLIRVTVIGCLLFLSLVVQFAVLYLFLYLFQLATYRGLAGVVPWLVQGGFSALLAVGGLAAMRREKPAGLLLGGGLLLLAAAPFTVFAGGCEVAANTNPFRPLPHLVWRGLGVGIETANTACSAHLNGILLSVGYFLLARGLWLDALPELTVNHLPIAIIVD